LITQVVDACVLLEFEDVAVLTEPLGGGDVKGRSRRFRRSAVIKLAYE